MYYGWALLQFKGTCCFNQVGGFWGGLHDPYNYPPSHIRPLRAPVRRLFSAARRQRPCPACTHHWIWDAIPSVERRPQVKSWIIRIRKRFEQRFEEVNGKWIYCKVLRYWQTIDFQSYYLLSRKNGKQSTFFRVFIEIEREKMVKLAHILLN